MDQCISIGHSESLLLPNKIGVVVDTEYRNVMFELIEVKNSYSCQ